METIECNPQGVCSWRYSFKLSDQTVSTDLRRIRDRGDFSIGEENYSVEKESFFKSAWLVKHENVEVAQAKKVRAFSRSWEIRFQQSDYLLRPESLFSRGFVLQRNDRDLLSIKTKHAFTRRSILTLFEPKLDARLIALSFWLVILILRRRAQAAAS